MMFDFDPVQTLGIAIMVLYTGMLLIRHTSFLRNNDIPVPVVGGLLFAVITSLGDEKLGGDRAISGQLISAREIAALHAA